VAMSLDLVALNEQVFLMCLARHTLPRNPKIEDEMDTRSIAWHRLHSALCDGQRVKLKSCNRAALVEWQ